MFKIGDFSRLSQVSVKALRYYDEIGLLRPAYIDRFTNYRYYTAGQLPRLNRILALKDLGLSLDQIADLLAADLPPDRIEDLLRQKRAALEQQLAEETARMVRVEARLRQIEQEGKLPDHDVVIKAVPAQRVAALRAVVPGYAATAGLFEELVAHLHHSGIGSETLQPWIVLYHDEGYREHAVDVTVAVRIERAIAPAGRVTVTELPAVETMACVAHRGPYDTLIDAYAALIAYMEANRLSISGTNRNLFLHGPGAGIDPAEYVTEVQFPVGEGVQTDGL